MTVVKGFDHTSETDASDLRKRGLLAADFQSRSSATKEIQLDVSTLRTALKETSGVGIFNLRLSGDDKAHKVVVCDRKSDPETKTLTHLSLREVEPNDTVVGEIQVRVEKQPDAPDSQELTVKQTKSCVRVRGPVKKLAKPIGVNLTDLRSGECLAAKDINLPPGVELLSKPDEVLFRVEEA